MEYRIPKKGEIYRHFKGNLYEIVIIARDSETLEEKVVYKEVDGDTAYVRSLPMFVSLVDKEKYPEVTQEFRFELVQETSVLQNGLENLPMSAVKSDEELEVKIADYGMIMEYLDLDTIDEKIQYLIKMKDCITDEFIGVVAQSLDYVENENSFSARYEALIRYLRTLAKYESGRLR